MMACTYSHLPITTVWKAKKYLKYQNYVECVDAITKDNKLGLSAGRPMLSNGKSLHFEQLSDVGSIY